MKIIKIIPLLFLSIFLAPIAYADNDYNKTGLVLLGSPDGSTWTQQMPADANNRLMGNAFQKSGVLDNNGLYTIAQSYDESSGFDYQLITSPDLGKSWNQNSCPWEYGTNAYSTNSTGTSCMGVSAYYDSLFTSQNGSQPNNIYLTTLIPSCNDLNVFDTSSNGKTFAVLATCVYSTIFPPTSIYPQSGILVTSDLTNWQWLANFPRNFQGSEDVFSSIQWNGSEWVVFGFDNNQVPSILTSVDGNSWNITVMPNTIKNVLSLAKNNKEWMALVTEGSGNVLLHSMDAGATWATETLPANWSTINKVNYNNGTWIVVGQTTSGTNLFLPAIAVSHDGTTWQNATLPFNILQPAATSTLNDVQWDGKEWIAEGAYEYFPIGCDYFSQVSFSGRLTGSGGGLTIDFFGFGKNTSFKLKKISNDTYNVEGSINYETDDGGNFGYGPIDGTCTDQPDGSATFSLNSQPLFTINGVHSTYGQNTINITSSCLENTTGGCANYIGSLTASPVAMHKRK